jgi:hypothetical protein
VERAGIGLHDLDQRRQYADEKHCHAIQTDDSNGSNNQRAASSEFPRSGGDLAAFTECPTETVTVARVLMN